ncbi:MAG: ABC transporter substrate-binding protein [Caldilinea sp.]|jgi:peptide/nickel transport system substrate-binding protein
MSDRLYKRVIGVASLFALVALMLTACVAPAPGAQPAADSAEAVEAPAETAAVDDSVSIGMNELVTSLDPPADWAIAATWIHMNLFDCLVWRNRETAVFEPWLAESYEQVSDKVWKLKLREGVKFHNGEAFNADAVKWTYERILGDETLITHKQWLFIKEIRALSPMEIEIETVDPEPAFLSKISGTGCGVQAPIAGMKQKEEGSEYTPIGTGPFKFVEWVKDDHITLAANEEYWQGAPAIKTLIWKAIPEVSTRVANLLTSDVDLVLSVPAQDWERVNGNEGTEIKQFLTTQVMLLAMRIGPSAKYEDWTGITSNAKIREAIGLAIDRAALVDLIDGMGIPVLSRVTPPTLGWSEELYDQVGEYNPDRARELIQEAGYDGSPLTFHASTSWLKQKEVAEAVTAMLQDVGLNIDLQVLDVTTFREQIYFPYRNDEIYMDALGNSFFDPWIAVLSERADRRERSGWSGPLADEADQLIREAAVNMDPAARAEQYIKIQELINQDFVNVYLYQMYDTVGISKSLDWNPPLDGFLWMGNAKLK